jgi:hypothetical protein
MSGTTEIRAALVTRLTAASPGAAIPAASVAWEGTNFVPAQGTRWYRSTFLPGEPVTETIGEPSQNRTRGVFQIDVFDTKGTGDAITTAECERLVTCYKRGTVLVYSGVSVYIEKAYRGIGQQEVDWYHIPVIVRWRADTAR